MMGSDSRVRIDGSEVVRPGSRVQSLGFWTQGSRISVYRVVCLRSWAHVSQGQVVCGGVLTTGCSLQGVSGALQADVGFLHAWSMQQAGWYGCIVMHHDPAAAHVQALYGTDSIECWVHVI